MIAPSARTLDVVVQRVVHGRPKPSALLQGWLELRDGSVEVQSLTVDGGLRMAASSDARHVIVECDELLPEILSALSSRNQPRDFVERALRVHISVSPDNDTRQALEWISKAVSASRTQKIVLWHSVHSADALGDWRELTFARRLLGSIEVADDSESSFFETMIERLDKLGLVSQQAATGTGPNPEAAPTASKDDGNEGQFTRDRIEALLKQRLEPLALRLEKAVDALENPRATDTRNSTPIPSGEISGDAADRIEERLMTAMTQLEQSAEQRFAARLDAMADAWTLRVKENIVEASTQFIHRSNTAFGARAEHFTQRLEAFGQDELGRDKRFQEVTRNSVVRTLREWLEPRMDMKSRWFGIGAIACGICMVGGVAIGLVIPRVVG